VDDVLKNVCPNCGGGFVPRPIRPAINWRGNNYLGNNPASPEVLHRPVDAAEHAAFIENLRHLPPDER